MVLPRYARTALIVLITGVVTGATMALLFRFLGKGYLSIFFTVAIFLVTEVASTTIIEEKFSRPRSYYEND